MNRLRLVRTRRGWTQQRVSSLTGITQGRLSAFENGYAKPYEGERLRLLAALGIDDLSIDLAEEVEDDLP